MELWERITKVPAAYVSLSSIKVQEWKIVCSAAMSFVEMIGRNI